MREVVGRLVRYAAFIPVGVTVHDCLFTVMPVPDNTMQPTLEGGGDEWREWVLVNKLSPKLFRWTRGDVVLFNSPHNDSVKSIRRMLALDGDWVIAPHSNEVAHVPQGHCWIEGDAGHPTSELIGDRATPTLCGPVPLALVGGNVTHVIWPPNRIRPVMNERPRGRVILERQHR